VKTSSSTRGNLHDFKPSSLTTRELRSTTIAMPHYMEDTILQALPNDSQSPFTAGQGGLHTVICDRRRPSESQAISVGALAMRMDRSSPYRASTTRFQMKPQPYGEAGLRSFLVALLWINLELLVSLRFTYLIRGDRYSGDFQTLTSNDRRFRLDRVTQFNTNSERV
jgi:hypothetical protein